MGKAEAVIKKKDEQLQNKGDKINKLIDQLSWYRRKFWKSSIEKYIPEDPNQCKIDFDGLDVLPEEEEVIKDAEKEIITYEQEKPNTKKQPDHLRHEEKTTEPEGIGESWVRIGEEVTEVLEHTGRKNFLFCGNHDAAENTAMMYFLLGRCKALDVNPREWLIDLLSKIPEYNNDYFNEHRKYGGVNFSFFK